jgi:hypothetical protein
MSNGNAINRLNKGYYSGCLRNGKGRDPQSSASQRIRPRIQLIAVVAAVFVVVYAHP